MLDIYDLIDYITDMNPDNIANILDYNKFDSDQKLAEKIMRWLMDNRHGYTYHEVLNIAKADYGRRMSDRRIRQVNKKYGYEEVERVFKENGKLNYIRYRLLNLSPIPKPLKPQPSWVHGD